MKIKSIFCKEKNSSFKIMENINEMQKKILNEFTIYRLYFENEKMKMLLLNENQRYAFENLKLNYKTVLLSQDRNFDLKHIKNNKKVMDVKENGLIDQGEKK